MPSATPDEFEIVIADCDQHVTAIHRFLLMYGQPGMRCEVDIVKSLEEIIRVAAQDTALMLVKGGQLVGSMGVMKATWWYGNGNFLADRWHFIRPEFAHSAGAEMLMDAAIELAELTGMEFIHQGKIRKGKRGIGRIMPRSYGPDPAMVGQEN